ncbi:hypothetical protein ABZ387_07250 [Streptomyces flaveolus]|uniref:hypothetical protein n=1 Tax=Streptomyces flaveolus TaxID=67297 RepID=UPI003405346F
MNSSTRTNLSFFVPVVVALAAFAAIVLPGDLGAARFAAACAVFLIVAPGGAWVLSRTLKT